jgi:hypothetical protein
MSQTILKAAAGVAALAAIAFGASAIAGASNSGSSGGAAAMGGPPGMGGGPPGVNGAPPGVNGGPPGVNGAPGPRSGAPGGPRPFGQPVTGATATKVKAAALARYPGTVEQVVALPGGRGYVAHVIRSNGTELHVLVNSTFQVVGAQAGPGPGAPPSAGAARARGAST